MLDHFKAFFVAILSPVAKLFIRLGISADVVTVVGTIGVCTGALVFFPQGELTTGVLVITAFVFSDLLDGHMARLTGKTNKFGAFLDSTLDRLGDAAIFGGLVLYFAGPGDSDLYMVLALACLVLGSLTSYARAKAEGLGFNATVGIAERADRLVAILVMTGFSDIFDLPILLEGTLWLLAAASFVTVVQRMWVVRKQAYAEAAAQAS